MVLRKATFRLYPDAAQSGRLAELLGLQRMKHGQVRLSGVGRVKMRGQARTPGEVKTAEVQHQGGRWYLSVTVACDPQRTGGTQPMGMDWGLETFATVVHAPVIGIKLPKGDNDK